MLAEIHVIPTNIYGPADNYNLDDAHVIPSLIHKCYLSKLNSESFIIAGSGKPLRQFIYSEVLAKLFMWGLESYNDKSSIILSVGEKEEVSIGANIFFIILDNLYDLLWFTSRP